MIKTDENYVEKVEIAKSSASFKMAEKNRYLGIYKERVLLALTIDAVMEKIVYDEVVEALKNKKAKLMTISRSIDLKYIKKYMYLAEKNGLSCKMVDGLSYVGDVGLVISASDAVPQNKELVIDSIKNRLKQRNLSPYYYDALNTNLCSKHYEEIKENFPEISHKYGKISAFARLLGIEDIIDEKGDK